mmetsp:Transcript_29544/g.43572  ORF Transcript_29544/g.43572 Transcript_29544/m.43572 type:complete len:330 (-) Transcript_29544:104-1093(-)
MDYAFAFGRKVVTRGDHTEPSPSSAATSALAPKQTTTAATAGAAATSETAAVHQAPTASSGMRNWRSFFQRHRENGNNYFERSRSNGASMKYILAYYLPIFLTVILPWIIYSIVRSRGDGEEGGSGDEENRGGWWYWLWGGGGNNDAEDGEEDNNNDNNEENRLLYWWNGGGDGEGGSGDREEGRNGIQGLFVGIVYLWTLLMFAFLVYFGHVVLFGDHRNRGGTKPLLTAFIMFANLCFLCFLLVQSLWFSGDERDREEAVERYGGWFGTFAGGVVGLSLLFWTLWSLIMACVFYRKMKRDNNTGGVGKVFNNEGTDYRRQDDSGGLI